MENITLHFWALILFFTPVSSYAAGSKDLGSIWFIGDSITQSNADKDNKGSPRKSLYDLLTKDSYHFTFTGHRTNNVDGLPKTGSKPTSNLYHYHSGLSGYLIGDDKPMKTTKKLQGLMSNLDKHWKKGRLAKVKPDIILIMLGTNDINQGYEIESAPKRLRVLLDKIYSLPNIGTPKIFLATIPPNGKTEEVKTNTVIFNKSVPLIVSDYKAQGKDIYFVDQFTPINDDYEAAMCSDNLHPNSKGNDLMAQQWFEAIQASEITTSKTK